jgi:hypothetical protein
MRRHPVLGVAIAALLALVVGVWPVAAADQEGCLICHGLPGFSRGEGGRPSALSVNGAEMNTSRHGQVGCRGCHRGIISIPHEAGAEKVNCGLECHVLAEGSGKPYSHDALYWEFMGSAHGKDSRNPVVCVDCHPTNPPATARLESRLKTERCVACHLSGGGAASGRGAATRGRESVRRHLTDIHGRFVAAGGRLAPACSDCHSTHGVLPAENPQSSVHRARLPATCAGAKTPGGERSCHREASTAALAGMTPLGDRWPGLPGGWFFLWTGLILSALLVLRALSAIVRRSS